MSDTLAAGACVAFPQLSFASVNRPGRTGYDPELQRHHILPRQALEWPGLRQLFSSLDKRLTGFDDFRRNGLLLPAREGAALRLGLPMHLGPHREYNLMVIERLGRIEGAWSRRRRHDEPAARTSALHRIAALQSRLRGRILDQRDPLRFRHDCVSTQNRDFSLLDRMAEELWVATGS